MVLVTGFSAATKYLRVDAGEGILKLTFCDFVFSVLLTLHYMYFVGFVLPNI